MCVLFFEGDGYVIKLEFVMLWQFIIYQNQEYVEVFFYLVDLNDDNIIDFSDLNFLYNVFDIDGKIQIIRIFFIIFDEYIIIILYIYVVILMIFNFVICVYYF